MNKWFLIFFLFLFCPSGFASLYYDGADDYTQNTSLSALTSGFTVYIYAKYDDGKIVSVFGSARSVGSNSGWILKAEQWNNTGKLGFTKAGVADFTSNILVSTSWAGYVYIVQSVNVIICNATTCETLASVTPNTPASDGFCVGTSACVFLNSDYFIGTVSEWAIWNREFTESEAKNLINSKIKRAPLQYYPSNLKVYYSFDELKGGTSADGATAIDWSGNGNDATSDDGGNNTGMTSISEQALSYW